MWSGQGSFPTRAEGKVLRLEKFPLVQWKLSICHSFEYDRYWIWNIAMPPKTAFAPNEAELHLQGCSFGGICLQGGSCSIPPRRAAARRLSSSCHESSFPRKINEEQASELQHKDGEGNTICASPVWRRAGLVWEGLRPTPKQNNMFERKGPFILKDVLLHERPFWYACVCLARSTADYSLWNTFQCLRLCFHPKPTVL